MKGKWGKDFEGYKALEDPWGQDPINRKYDALTEILHRYEKKPNLEMVANNT